jgi:hypothetical protein
MTIRSDLPKATSVEPGEEFPTEIGVLEGLLEILQFGGQGLTAAGKWSEDRPTHRREIGIPEFSAGLHIRGPTDRHWSKFRPIEIFFIEGPYGAPGINNQPHRITSFLVN